VDCGEGDPLVLEFDHKSDKIFNVSKGLSTAAGRACWTRSPSVTWFVQTVTGDAPLEEGGSHARW
jgi:hypothetical protein